MNILFYQDTVGVSGAEMYIADTASRLRELGHQISFACPSRSWMERQALHKGFPYVDFSIEDGTDNHLHWTLTGHILSHEIDVIFCSTPGKRPEVPRLDAAVKAAGRGRIVIRVGVSPGSERAFAPERLGIGYDSVDGIVAVSDDVRHNLLNFYPQLDESRILVIYNGVDLARYDSDRYDLNESQSVRREIGIPDGDAVIAAIGRLDPIKNLPLLIDSAEQVLATCPRTSFVIAGYGAEREPLERLVSQRGLKEKVLFVGEIEDVPRLLLAVDIVCHPSLSEGIPNALLEAMAAGKAIVASDVGGIAELVTHDRTGWLFPTGDSTALTERLLGLLRQPSEIDRLSEAARHHVLVNFDRSRNVEEVEKLLFSCVSETRSVPGGVIPETYVPDDSFIAQPILVM